MFKNLLFIFVVLFFAFVFSQKFSAIGHVNDSSNHPVAYANVVLMASDGEETVIGTTTNDFGDFEAQLTSGKYLLKISFLGFAEHTQEILVEDNLDLKTITLKESLQQLEGVTVVAKRPTVTRLIDRLVFNVENSTLSNSNALDVLKHTPGVIVGDNSISVKMSVPVIYINDRRV